MRGCTVLPGGATRRYFYGLRSRYATNALAPTLRVQRAKMTKRGFRARRGASSRRQIAFFATPGHTHHFELLRQKGALMAIRLHQPEWRNNSARWIVTRAQYRQCRLRAMILDGMMVISVF